MMRPGDEYRYQHQHQQSGPGFAIGGAPHGVIMAVVVGLVVGGPLFLGDGGEAITSAIADLLGPTGLLLLPVALILVIRVLSSDRGAAGALADALALGGSPDSVHRVGGSPVGVALALALIAVLLYYRSALLGGGDGGDDE